MGAIIAMLAKMEEDRKRRRQEAYDKADVNGLIEALDGGFVAIILGLIFFLAVVAYVTYS